jgi:hypothetical protein
VWLSCLPQLTVADKHFSWYLIMRNFTKICLHVWAWWYQMYLHIVRCRTGIKYKRLCLRYLIKLLWLAAKNSQVFTDGTVIIPAHRHYLHYYEPTKQSINRPTNHAFAQLFQPWCVCYIKSWTTLFKYICLLALARCAWYINLQQWPLESSRNVILCAHYLTF